ncbi:unnamed protein product [Closterium sp. Naga37s-1]|nr:unnamed protein product [Closterium sp. Naga37s-1]
MDSHALALTPSALFPAPVLSSACAARVFPANGARRSRTSAVAPIRASAQAENQPSTHPSISATPPSAASAASPEALPRRSALAGGLLALASATLSAYLPLPALPPVAHAAADAAATVEAAGGSDLLKGLRSAFDSEELTASGRRLPKAYVRSVTALISSLRDALGAEEGDRGEFRRKAEVAKGAIRAYLGEWRGKAPENTEGTGRKVERGEGGTRGGWNEGRVEQGEELKAWSSRLTQSQSSEPHCPLPPFPSSPPSLPSPPSPYDTTTTPSRDSALKTLSQFYMPDHQLLTRLGAQNVLPLLHAQFRESNTKLPLFPFSHSLSAFPHNTPSSLFSFPPNQIITSSLDSVLRTLSRFYMRSGVNAKLPADVRDGILADLALAEAAL